jgi:hypothetical protein
MNMAWVNPYRFISNKMQNAGFAAFYRRHPNVSDADAAETIIDVWNAMVDSAPKPTWIDFIAGLFRGWN